MSFAHPHFAEPHWLWLAALAPLAVVLLHRYAAWARKKQLGLFAAPELVANLVRSHSPAHRAVKNLLLVLAVAGTGFALARPQWGETAEISRALGEDILFMLDCSRSMLAADVQPNRLSRAKYAIMDFVQRHGRGRGFLRVPTATYRLRYVLVLLAHDRRRIVHVAVTARSSAGSLLALPAGVRMRQDLTSSARRR